MSTAMTPTATATSTRVPTKPPPPGKTSNFVNPADLGFTVDVTQITLMAVTCLFTALRIGALAFFKRPFWWDDGTYFFAFTCSVGRIHYSLVRKKVSSFRHQWDIPKPKRPSKVGPRIYKRKFAVLTLEALALYGSKMSILLLFLRVFSVQKFTRIALYIAMLLTFGVWLFVQVTTSLNRAPPIGKPWTAEGLIRDVTHQPIINKVAGFLILALDIIIFIIPMHATWNLQMTRKWKIQVFLVFGTASLAVVAAILSAYVRVSQDYEYDRSWSGGLIFIYGNIEIYISLIVACIPAAVACYTKGLASFRSNLSSRFPSVFRSSRVSSEKKSGSNNPASAPAPAPALAPAPFTHRQPSHSDQDTLAADDDFLPPRKPIDDVEAQRSEIELADPKIGHAV